MSRRELKTAAPSQCGFERPATNQERKVTDDEEPNHDGTRIVYMAGLMAMLQGCRSPASDMINNNFISITPEPVPSGLEGVWSGDMGPYLASMQWQADGHGLFCYSYGTANVLQKVKFAADVFYIEDGTRLELKEQGDQSVTVHASYAVGQDTVLHVDPDYQLASAFCGNALICNTDAKFTENQFTPAQ
jgi:hypothetical protein